MITVSIYFAVCLIVSGLAFALHMGPMSQVLVLLMGLAVLPIQKFIHKRPLSDLGFRACSWKQLIIAALLPCGIVGSIALIDIFGGTAVVQPLTTLKNPFTGGTPMTSVLDLAGFLAVYTGILFCLEFVTEELMFRGYILGALRRLGERKAVLISAGIFAIWHLPLAIWEVGFDPARTTIYIANMFLLGMLFGYVYVESNSLIPAALFHALWNGLEYNLFGFANQQMLFTGTSRIIFDPEEGLIGTGVMLLVLGVFYFSRKKETEQFLDPSLAAQRVGTR
jgi:membrane protease YdiL (CAAX protease family)